MRPGRESCPVGRSAAILRRASLSILLALLAASQALALDEQAERFVRLALELGEYDTDYVDAYLGPEEWRDEARENLRSEQELAVAIDELLTELRAYTPEAGLAIRHRALLRNAVAMDARIRMVLGERFSFAEEARRLYDLTLPAFDFADFDRTLEEIDALFPGPGALADRVEAFRAGLEIAEAQLDRVMTAAIDECRRRTLAQIDVPATERFRLEYVTDQSWSGYNWYQGDYESLMQINVDLPVRIGSAVSLGCHEGYPGHHVWNMLLESRLLNDRGWVEFSVFPLFSPAALIAEGSAEYGIDLAFPGDARLRFEREFLYPLAGLEPDQAEIAAALGELSRELAPARVATAALYLDGAISRDDAIGQLRRYGLQSQERAERGVRFIEQYRSYVVNYSLGEAAVRAWVEREPDEASRWRAFERLLTELLTASDMIQDR